MLVHEEGKCTCCLCEKEFVEIAWVEPTNELLNKIIGNGGNIAKAMESFQTAGGHFFHPRYWKQPANGKLVAACGSPYFVDVSTSSVRPNKRTHHGQVAARAADIHFESTREAQELWFLRWSHSCAGATAILCEQERIKEEARLEKEEAERRKLMEEQAAIELEQKAKKKLDSIFGNSDANKEPEPPKTTSHPANFQGVQHATGRGVKGKHGDLNRQHKPSKKDKLGEDEKE